MTAPGPGQFPANDAIQAQRLAQLEQLQVQRLGMFMADMVNAMTWCVGRAESGDAQAKTFLEMWDAAVERSRAIRSGITVARKL